MIIFADTPIISTCFAQVDFNFVEKENPASTSHAVEKFIQMNNLLRRFQAFDTIMALSIEYVHVILEMITFSGQAINHRKMGRKCSNRGVCHWQETSHLVLEVRGAKQPSTLY